MAQLEERTGEAFEFAESLFECACRRDPYLISH